MPSKEADVGIIQCDRIGYHRDQAGVFFTTYEHSKSLIASPSSPLHGAPLTLTHLLASSTAELVSCVVLTPAEVMKQQAQVRNQATMDARASGQALKKVADLASTGTTQGASEAVMRAKQEGRKAFGPLLGNFGRSYKALAGRNLPFTAIQFPIYEMLRAKLGDQLGLESGTHSHDGKVDDVDVATGDRAAKAGKGLKGGGGSLAEFAKAGLVSGASAAVAGSISAAITTPIDVAKTRIMLSTRTEAQSEAKGVLKTMQAISAKEGWKALFKGGALRSAWTALGAGIYLGSYESGRLWWRNRTSHNL